MPRGYPRMRATGGKLNVVGERVKARRKSLNLTREQLCGRIASVSEQQWAANEADIYKVEDGRRSVHDVEVLALAKALECDACWLLAGDRREDAG